VQRTSEYILLQAAKQLKRTFDEFQVAPQQMSRQLQQRSKKNPEDAATDGAVARSVTKRTLGVRW
jgi:hypothetical protein